MAAERRFTVRGADADVAVRIEGDGTVHVAGHDRPFEVTRAADGTYVVSDGAERWVVHAAGTRAEPWLFTNGRTYRVAVEASGSRRVRRRHHGDAAAAPMPATVVGIAVAPGDAVRAGDLVLTLEAMKMELPVRAPRDGVVSAVLCRVGELVQPGVTLVEIV